MRVLKLNDSLMSAQFPSIIELADTHPSSNACSQLTALSAIIPVDMQTIDISKQKVNVLRATRRMFHDPSCP